MENFPQALEYAGLAFDSAGTAEEKFKAYSEGAEAALNRLKVTWEKFAKDLVSSDLIINLVNLGNVLLQLVSSPFATFILKTAAMWAALKLGVIVLSKIVVGIKTLKLTITGLTRGFELLTLMTKSAIGTANLHEKALLAQATAAEVATVATAAFNAAIAIASLAIVGYITHLNKKAQKEEEARQKAKDDLKNLQDQRKSLDQLIDKYKELKSAAVQDESTRENIKNVQEQIRDIVGDEADELDLVNGKLERQLELLQGIKFENLGKEADAAWLVIEKTWNKIYDKSHEIPIAGEWTWDFKSQWKDLAAHFGYYGVEQFFAAYRNTLSKGLPSIKELYQGIVKDVDSYVQDAKERGWDIDKQDALDFASELQQIITDLENADYTVLLQKFYDQFSDVTYESAGEYKQAKEQFLKEVEDWGLSPSKFTKLFVLMFPQFEKTTSDTEKVINKLGASLKELTSAYDVLSSAMKDFNENGSISYENFQKLLDLQPEYLNYLFDENGEIRNQINVLEELMRAEIMERTNQAALSFLRQFEGKTREEVISMLQVETAATDELTASINDQIKAQLLSLALDEKTTKMLANRISNMFKLANSVSFSSSKSSKSTSQEDKYAKAISYVTVTIDKKIKALQKEKEAIEDVVEAQEKELDQYDKALSYINKYVSARIKELEDEKKALEDKNDETSREIELEELKNNLQKARQRSMRVYREGVGWVYEQDPEQLRDAQKAMDDFQVENLTEAIEKLIEQWQEYLDLWEKIPDTYEDYAEELAFKESQNFVTEEDLRNKNLSGLEKFRQAYFQKEKSITETTTDEIDKQIDSLNELKDKWSNIKSDIEYEQNAIIAQQILGSSLEADILEGRIKNIDTFASEYANAMDRAASSAEGAARRIGSALGGIDLSLSAEEFPKTKQEIFTKQFRAGVFKNRKKKEQNQILLSQGFTEAEIKALSLIDFSKYDNILDLYSSPLARTLLGLSGFNLPSMEIVQSQKNLPGYSNYASGTKNSRGGIANVDELGNELIIDPPTHGRYTILRDGSGVLPHNLTQRIFDVANNPANYIVRALKGISPNSILSNNSGSTNNNTSINISKIELPNVTNVEDFVKELQIISANR